MNQTFFSALLAHCFGFYNAASQAYTVAGQIFDEGIIVYCSTVTDTLTYTNVCGREQDVW